MPLKEFTGNAPTTRLSGSLASGVTTTFTVLTGGGTGYPTGAAAPFVVVIDRGTSLEEKILCSSRSGDVFTIASSGRGYDDTTAQNHAAQAVVEHCLDANTVEEANAHVNDDARDDHSQYLNAARHDIEGRHAFGSALGTPAAAVNVTGKDTNSAGVLDDAAREDHRHGLLLPRFTLSRGTPQSIPDGATGDLISWGSQVEDTDDFWSSGSSITLPWAGPYIISVGVKWASNATGYRRVDFELSFSTSRVPPPELIGAVSTTDTWQSVCGLAVPTTAAETLVIRARQTSGGALNISTAFITGVYLGS